jgi:excisionase family DNA binding protein
MSDFLTVKDISYLVKVSRQTVIRWIRAGKLQALKPGGRLWRVRRSEFQRFVKLLGGRSK